MCFVGRSTRWGGAPAFLEHRTGGPTALGRRYLVTLEQFADVQAQENRRRPGELALPEGDGSRLLPCGFCARFVRGDEGA